MRVILAGYNLDSEVIQHLKNGRPAEDNLTPEVLSASYARISRDPAPVDQLRKSARQEVGAARRSNQNIIFKMGHHSVAEHAVFNFDIIDLSRFGMEELEKFRLCSYTEKSQRYQKLENNYFIPDEIRGTEFEADFVRVIEHQNSTYQKLAEKVEPEDARYITSLVTYGQLGLTLNARNLELMFRRFASSKFSELKQLGNLMFHEIEKIAPSIILFTNPNPLDQNTYEELKGFCKKWDEGTPEKTEEVTLESYPPDADKITLSALLHSASSLSFEASRKRVEKMSRSEQLDLVKTALKNMEFFDAPLREFEYVDLTFEIVLSAACFGQLKRHRMAALTCQDYNPKLGITIPPSIKAAGLEFEFTKTIEETEKVYQALSSRPALQPFAHYILTNAHRKRVLFKCNARELYHIARLREDAHAQWDIQNISKKMSALALEVMPLTLLTIGGKDTYPEVYNRIFGEAPRLKAEF